MPLEIAPQMNSPGSCTVTGSVLWPFAADSQGPCLFFFFILMKLSDLCGSQSCG